MIPWFYFCLSGSVPSFHGSVPRGLNEHSDTEKPDLEFEVVFNTLFDL